MLEGSSTGGGSGYADGVAGRQMWTRRRRSWNSGGSWRSWRTRWREQEDVRASGVEMLVAGSRTGKKLVDLRDAQRVAGGGGVATLTACLRVLFSRRGNTAPLVALGALVVLLVVVGFEPAIQVMLGVEEGLRSEEGGAVRAVREVGGVAFGKSLPLFQDVWA